MNEVSSLEKIQSALVFVSPHDRDMWIRMGMAIKSELGDGGYWVWDEWSQEAESYHKSSARAVWKSIKLGGKVTIATLFYAAKQAGWEWKKPEKKLTHAEVEARKEASRLRAQQAAAEKAAQQAKAAERAQAIWDAAEPVTAHPYLVKKGVDGAGLRVGKWEVIDQATGEVRTISSMALLIPITDKSRKIWSIQAVYPKPVNGRDKDYLAGGAKAGNFFAIGSPKKHQGQLVFVLAEGYATAASIHAATGHCVLTCFDTGNLLTVAISIREARPEAVILLAADNDQYHANGRNPGIEAANKAAIEVGGLVAVPVFESLDGQPTDFNDLMQLEGVERVAEIITQALENPSEPEPEPEAEPEEETETETETATIDATGAVDDNNAPEVDEAELAEAEHLIKNRYFTILGYDHDTYYFFVHAKQQVLSRSKSDFNEMGFLELANDINWWEMYWPAEKGGVNTKAAASWIYDTAHKRGVYDPANVRGRGAWIDDNRAIYHLGDVLLVDGQLVGIADISSSYVYPRAKKLTKPADTPLSKEEGAKLLQVAQMVRWSMGGSSVLLTGWTFLSPICGALKWRPHIWLTGPAGSGKSTVHRDFCHALTKGVSRYGQGDSTEPGIRQALKSDAIPVLIDEIESNDEREKARTESVLAMMRKASSETGAETMKGTASGEGQHFLIRSMFCLSSVNTKLDKQADIDRVTKLNIRVPPKDGSQIEHWFKLEAELRAISDDETLPRRFLARSISMINTIRESVRVFIRLASKHFKSQRMGDQYGTLMAGCWCLCNDHIPSDQEAQDMIDLYNWEEHTEDADQDDASEALRSILSAKIRMTGVASGELSVYELIRDAMAGYSEDVVPYKVAQDTLKRHGIKIDKGKDGEDVLLFGTSVPSLRGLLKGTSYSTDARGQLLRLPGASRWENKMARFNGRGSKCVSIPLSLVLNHDDKDDDDDDYPL